MKYAIYVKLPEKKRWYALSGGNITNKLIHAELWAEKEIAEKVCKSLQSINDDMKFEVREV